MRYVFDRKTSIKIENTWVKKLKSGVATHQASSVLVADEIGLLALLVSSPEELATAEADDAAVVTDVHVTHFSLILNKINLV